MLLIWLTLFILFHQYSTCRYMPHVHTYKKFNTLTFQKMQKKECYLMHCLFWIIVRGRKIRQDFSNCYYREIYKILQYYYHSFPLSENNLVAIIYFEIFTHRSDIKCTSSAPFMWVTQTPFFQIILGKWRHSTIQITLLNSYQSI